MLWRKWMGYLLSDPDCCILLNIKPELGDTDSNQWMLRNMKYYMKNPWSPFEIYYHVWISNIKFLEKIVWKYNSTTMVMLWHWNFMVYLLWIWKCTIVIIFFLFFWHLSYYHSIFEVPWSFMKPIERNYCDVQMVIPWYYKVLPSWFFLVISMVNFKWTWKGGGVWVLFLSDAFEIIH